LCRGTRLTGLHVWEVRLALEGRHGGKDPSYAVAHVDGSSSSTAHVAIEIIAMGSIRMKPETVATGTSRAIRTVPLVKAASVAGRPIRDPIVRKQVSRHANRNDFVARQVIRGKLYLDGGGERLGDPADTGTGFIRDRARGELGALGDLHVAHNQVSPNR
jgi:hypothetical protein